MKRYSELLIAFYWGQLAGECDYEAKLLDFEKHFKGDSQAKEEFDAGVLWASNISTNYGLA